MDSLFPELQTPEPPPYLLATPVVNRHHRKPYDVYIGRGSKWGNPFILGEDGTREEVIALFEKYLLRTPKLLAAVADLYGKTLGCYCAPKPCHGEVLARYAAAAHEKRLGR